MGPSSFDITKSRIITDEEIITVYRHVTQCGQTSLDVESA